MTKGRGPAIQTQVEVHGVPALVAALETGAVEVGDMWATFGNIAQATARLAAGFAPHRTGYLRSTIRAEHRGLYAAVQADAVYAGVINYGWRKRNIAPSYFMQRASAAIEPRIEPMVGAGVDKILKRRGLS